MPWSTVLILLGVALLIPTAYAGLIGAPYAPTRRAVVRKAFDAINLGAGDTVVDLGAGDGFIVCEAARRGANAIGYELSPIMWAVAWFRIKLLPLTKGESRAKRGVGVYFGNFYKQDISGATIIFVFLMPQNMLRLKKYLATQSLPHAKYLLSYSFPLPNVKPQQTITVPQKGTIYVYNVREVTSEL